MQAICHDTHNFMVYFWFDPAEAEIKFLGTWMILAAVGRKKSDSWDKVASISRSIS